jgi:hypothetical protein
MAAHEMIARASSFLPANAKTERRRDGQEPHYCAWYAGETVEDVCYESGEVLEVF